MAEIIFLVEWPIDIDAIKEKLSQYVNPKVFSLGYNTHQILDKNRIEHEIGESLLSTSDAKNIDDASIESATSWYNDTTISKLMTFEEINLGSLIELEILQYLTPIYGNAAIAMKIIEKELPKTVISYTYINDFVKQLCRKKNIDVISFDKKEHRSLELDKINIKYNFGSFPINLTIKRSTFLKIKKIMEKLINFTFGLNPNYKKSKQKTILVLDFNPVQYDILIKELSKIDGNVLLLNQRRPAIWNLQSFKIVTNSKCKIITLDRYEQIIKPQLNSNLNLLSNNLVKIWNMDEIFEKIFSFESYTLWYSIKNSFSKICNERFTESARRILLLKELLQEFNISCILEWAETGQEEKEVLHLAKRKGIKSIVLQHALESTSTVWNKYHRFVTGFSYSFASDLQAIWGQSMKNFALSHGYDEKKLVLTGSPRHDRFFSASEKTEKKGIILFTTTGVSGFSYENSPIECYKKYYDFVREVCRVVKNLPDKQLIVKPHPSADFLTNITNFIHEIDPQIPVIYNADLVELISSCDLLITINNSTTALESLILNTPAISLQAEKWTEDDEIVTSRAILSISKTSEIEKGIKDMLYNHEFKKKYLENGKKFVDIYFTNQGKASSFLADFLARF